MGVNLKSRDCEIYEFWLFYSKLCFKKLDNLTFTDANSLLCLIRIVIWNSWNALSSHKVFIIIVYSTPRYTENHCHGSSLIQVSSVKKIIFNLRFPAVHCVVTQLIVELIPTCPSLFLNTPQRNIARPFASAVMVISRLHHDWFYGAWTCN